MADIELVIKMPEELKEALDKAKKKNAFNYMQVYNDTLYDALKNGIPLPKVNEVLGKIRAEIESCEDKIDSNRDYDKTEYNAYIDAITDVLVIFDKYKAESGGSNADSN